MKKLFTKILIFFSLFFTFSCNKVFLVIDHLPKGTPPNEAIYLSGSFNNWTQDDDRYLFNDLEDGRLGLWLPMMTGEIEFKVTRGSWLTVETDSCGNDIPNRILRINKNGELLLDIENWKDLGAANCNFVDLTVKVDADVKPLYELYVVGSHNDWKLYDPIYRLRKIGDKLYQGRMPKRDEKIEYKINRGDWDQVEVAADGTALPNRILTKDTPDSLYLIVEEWRDEVIKQSPNLTIVIDKLPTIPKGSSIFLASNINNWNPANAIHRFVIPPGEDNYMLTVPRQGDEIFFKLTLGSWSTVETQSNGLIDIDNREWVYGLDDTIHIRVAGWKAD